ncbi:MAG: hypothetical protein RR327_04735, partial [Clostridia bacterium]
CGCPSATAQSRCGCGTAATQSRCGCQNPCVCGSPTPHSGCGCPSTTQSRCGSAVQSRCGCQNPCGCCHHCGCCCQIRKSKGASFLAPQLITVLASHPIPLIAEYNFSDGDITHEIDSHIVSLNSGVYQISYSFNAFASASALLKFGLYVNGILDAKTQIAQDVYAGKWNAFSKTFFLNVFDNATEIMIVNLSGLGIEIQDLNLTIKKVANEIL